ILLKTFFLFILSTLILNISIAQHLAGLWQGVITKGGLSSQAGDKFELYLEKDGSQIKGRSYIYLDNGNVIEMDVTGRLFDDRSMGLYDIQFISQEGSDFEPPFNRKYQLIYKKSVWESETSLKGYWQENITSPFATKRKRGRIFLKKASMNKV
ncbi:MAG: hypothetical protein GY705_04770, partial [Bacteroidetes bacterium]|nr:hypothetical protein [Bacteroidota bacterium]